MENGVSFSPFYSDKSHGNMIPLVWESTNYYYYSVSIFRHFYVSLSPKDVAALYNDSHAQWTNIIKIVLSV